ncbi:NAD(P)H-dependent oxidoreductase [Amycolatopsis sp. NPDC023774]|uniref:NADPH-dependent FMN reductase n=1 Tax=Amycolatopsis sp. NPDC023774 TaxID=3155015 RepID=UPI0033D3A671
MANRLVIIISSVRDGRFGPAVASWVAERARERGGFEAEVVDLADVEIPLSLPAASPSTPATATHAPPGWRC